MGIDFNHAKFVQRGNGFFRNQDTLHKLWLIDKYGALDNITPTNEDCVVTVQFKKGRKVSKITITGKPLGITFDTVEFKKAKPPDGEKEIHHIKDYNIVKITVDDKVAQATTLHKPLTKGKCTIGS